MNREELLLTLYSAIRKSPMDLQKYIDCCYAGLSAALDDLRKENYLFREAFVDSHINLKGAPAKRIELKNRRISEAKHKAGIEDKTDEAHNGL